MSGAEVGETPNAAFAVLSAASSVLGNAGLPPGLTEVPHFLEICNDKAFTESQDRRYRALNGLGLSKAGKVALATVALFKTGSNLDKWMESVWTCTLPIKAAWRCSTGFTRRTTGRIGSRQQLAGGVP